MKRKSPKKLSEYDILKIKKLRRDKNSLRSIGDLYGVSRQRIHQIVGNTGFKIYIKCPLGFRSCYLCKRILPEKSFYMDAQSKGGKNRCRSCLKEKSSKYGKRNKHFYMVGGKYYKQSRARREVYQALKKGTIIKGRCKIGNDCRGRIEAHHHNGYSKKHYLDVIWLCSKHHYMVDKGKLALS